MSVENQSDTNSDIDDVTLASSFPVVSDGTYIVVDGDCPSCGYPERRVRFDEHGRVLSCSQCRHLSRELDEVVDRRPEPGSRILDEAGHERLREYLKGRYPELVDDIKRSTVAGYHGAARTMVVEIVNAEIDDPASGGVRDAMTVLRSSGASFGSCVMDALGVPW